MAVAIRLENALNLHYAGSSASKSDVKDVSFSQCIQKMFEMFRKLYYINYFFQNNLSRLREEKIVNF